MKTLVFTNGFTTIPLLVRTSDSEEVVNRNFDIGWLCINSYQSMIESEALAIKINTVGEYYELYVPHQLKSSMNRQQLEQMLITAGHIC